MERVEDDFYFCWPSELSYILSLVRKLRLRSTYKLGPTQDDMLLMFINKWDNWGKSIGKKWECILSNEQQSAISGKLSKMDISAAKQLEPTDAGIDAQNKSVGSPLPYEILGKMGYTQESMTEMLQSVQNRLEEKDFGIKKLEAENKTLSLSLASYMSGKIGEDETDLECISVKNRPLAIADEYGEFVSYTWLEAKNALDDRLLKLSEELKCNFLNRLLLDSYSYMEQCHDMLMEKILQTLSNPGGSGSESVNLHYKSYPKQQMAPDLMKAINKYLRIQSDAVNFKHQGDEVLNRICAEQSRSDYYIRSLVNSTRLRKFCKTACELCWKMILQQPPMYFDISGIRSTFDPHTQELCHNSADGMKSGMAVLYYKSPILFHGNKSTRNVLRKGQVMVGRLV